jgi:hypothetical protein
MILRENDTLRFVLDTTETLSGDVTYTLDDTVVAESAPGVPVNHLFDTAGVYILVATAQTAGAPVEQQVEIEVRTADLGDPFYVLSTSAYAWTPPELGGPLDLETDPKLSVNEQTEPEEPRSFGVQGSVPEPRYLAARAWEGDEEDMGPILDTVPVRTLRVAGNEAVQVEVDYVFSDGTKLVTNGIVLDHVPEDLEVRVEIFVAGVTFTDGSLTKILTAADFDEYGRANFQFLQAPDVDSSVCRRLYIHLGDAELGSI